MVVEGKDTGSQRDISSLYFFLLPIFCPTQNPVPQRTLLLETLPNAILLYLMSKLLDTQQQQPAAPPSISLCHLHGLLNDKHSTDILLGSISIHTHSHSQIASVPTHTAVHRSCISTHTHSHVRSLHQYPHTQPFTEPASVTYSLWWVMHIMYTHTLKHGHTQKRYLCLFSSLSLSYPPLRTWHLNCNVYQLSFKKQAKKTVVAKSKSGFVSRLTWLSCHLTPIFMLSSTKDSPWQLLSLHGAPQSYYPFLLPRNWTPQLSVLTSPFFSFLHVFLWYYNLIPYFNCHLYATDFEFLHFPWGFIGLQTNLLNLVENRHSDAWQPPSS